MNENVEKFGRLTITEIVSRSPKKVRCVCDCGNVVVVFYGHLLSGRSKSCGCLRKDVLTTHGMHKHPAYSVWSAAKSRVSNPKNKKWKDYGGRGIEMCPEWLASFESFWADMGESYVEGLTLERVNVNGNYCKENCKWDTYSTQGHNRRKSNNRSSQYIGVSFRKDRGTYYCRIMHQGNRICLGTHASELVAATIYDDKSEELYGDRPNGTTRGSREADSTFETQSN